MKAIYLFVIASLCSLSSFAAPNAEEIKGEYYQVYQGKVELVATVYQYAGEMKIKFDGGCAATLVRRAPYWEASCDVGTGYTSGHYEARVKEHNSKYVLLYKAEAYGDSEIFPGFSAAYKK